MSWEEAGLFASLERDWRALERRAEETGTVPFFLPGYRAVMARAAGLAAVGDLTGDLQRLVDRMLAEHRRHLAHDREVRGLVERIQEHGRRWPELGWAAAARGVDEIAGHAAWREDAAALAEDGRRRLAANGEARRHLEAMPGTGLADALAGLERTCRLDDARRFERLWEKRRERAASEGVPELLGEGYAEVASLAERLETADGLDPRARDAVADWREVHDEQAALAEEVRALPERLAAWNAAPVPGALDPADPARAAWRKEGRELEALGRKMLEPDDVHAPYIDAAPGAREAVRKAVGEVSDMLDRDRLQGFAWLTKEVNRTQSETRAEPYYLPRYGEAVDAARALSGHGELPEKTQKAVDSWLQYHGRAEALRGEIRDWPARAEALLAKVPPPDAPLDALTEWRERADTLLDDSRAMRAGNGPYAAHMDRMPEEAKAVAVATPGLDAAAVQVEHREMRLLMRSARAFVERTGGILYDAPVHGALMERAGSLGARDGLPEPVSRSVNAVVAVDAQCAKDRERVGAFIEAAGEVESERGDLDAAAGAGRTSAVQLPGSGGWEEKARAVVEEAGAIREEIPPRQLNAHLASFGFGPDEADDRKKKIEKRIERDRQAREAAEAARRAALEARVAEQDRRLIERFEAAVRDGRERAKLTGRLKDCLKERRDGDREHSGLFVFREPHREWMSGAEALLAKANRHLEEAGTRDPDREKDEGTKTLRGLVADLDRTLREDRATIERIEKEPAREQTRRQDRSRGRGFSM